MSVHDYPTTMSTSSGPTPTLESIMRAMDEIFPRLKEGTEKLAAATDAFSSAWVGAVSRHNTIKYDLGPVGVPSMLSDMFLGVRVIQSFLAMERVSRRKHKLRRGQTKAYHRRIQKKWDKRFGFEQRPCAYRLADGSLVVHPSIYKQLKEAVT